MAKGDGVKATKLYTVVIRHGSHTKVEVYFSFRPSMVTLMAACKAQGFGSHLLNEVTAGRYSVERSTVLWRRSEK